MSHTKLILICDGCRDAVDGSGGLVGIGEECSACGVGHYRETSASDVGTGDAAARSGIASGESSVSLRAPAANRPAGGTRAMDDSAAPDVLTMGEIGALRARLAELDAPPPCESCEAWWRQSKAVRNENAAFVARVSTLESELREARADSSEAREDIKALEELAEKFAQPTQVFLWSKNQERVELINRVIRRLKNEED
jgi:hypothetical protein